MQNLTQMLMQKWGRTSVRQAASLDALLLTTSAMMAMLLIGCVDEDTTAEEDTPTNETPESEGGSETISYVDAVDGFAITIDATDTNVDDVLDIHFTADLTDIDLSYDGEAVAASDTSGYAMAKDGINHSIELVYTEPEDSVFSGPKTVTLVYKFYDGHGYSGEAEFTITIEPPEGGDGDPADMVLQGIESDGDEVVLTFSVSDKVAGMIDPDNVPLLADLGQSGQYDENNNTIFFRADILAVKALLLPLDSYQFKMTLGVDTYTTEEVSIGLESSDPGPSAFSLDPHRDGIHVFGDSLVAYHGSDAQLESLIADGNYKTDVTVDDYHLFYFAEAGSEAGLDHLIGDTSIWGHNYDLEASMIDTAGYTYSVITESATIAASAVNNLLGNIDADDYQVFDFAQAGATYARIIPQYDSEFEVTGFETQDDSPFALGHQVGLQTAAMGGNIAAPDYTLVVVSGANDVTDITQAILQILGVEELAKLFDTDTSNDPNLSSIGVPASMIGSVVSSLDGLIGSGWNGSGEDELLWLLNAGQLDRAESLEPLNNIVLSLGVQQLAIAQQGMLDIDPENNYDYNFLLMQLTDYVSAKMSLVYDEMNFQLGIISVRAQGDPVFVTEPIGSDLLDAAAFIPAPAMGLYNEVWAQYEGVVESVMESSEVYYYDTLNDALMEFTQDYIGDGHDPKNLFFDGIHPGPLLTEYLWGSNASETQFSLSGEGVESEFTFDVTVPTFNDFIFNIIVNELSVDGDGGIESTLLSCSDGSVVDNTLTFTEEYTLIAPIEASDGTFEYQQEDYVISDFSANQLTISYSPSSADSSLNLDAYHYRGGGARVPRKCRITRIQDCP